MAHYALIDENHLVTQVIVGKDENEDGVDWEAFYGEFYGCVCKRTSYNTHGGVHGGGGVPFRKNYAGIGYTYDEARDAFIPPKPGDNFTFDEDGCQWIRNPELKLAGDASPIIIADGVDSVTVYLYGAANSVEEVTLNGEAMGVNTDAFGYGEFELASDTPGLIVVEWGGFSLEVAAL